MLEGRLEFELRCRKLVTCLMIEFRFLEVKAPLLVLFSRLCGYWHTEHTGSRKARKTSTSPPPLLLPPPLSHRLAQGRPAATTSNNPRKTLRPFSPCAKSANQTQLGFLMQLFIWSNAFILQRSLPLLLMSARWFQFIMAQDQRMEVTLRLLDGNRDHVYEYVYGLKMLITEQWLGF